MSWAHLHSYPPIMVRVFARRERNGHRVSERALSNAEIAIASGLGLVRVETISRATSWDDVTVGEAERFCLACHFNPLSAPDRNRKRSHDRQCQLTAPEHRYLYLRKHPAWRTELLPLIEKLKNLSARAVPTTALTVNIKPRSATSAVA